MEGHDRQGVRMGVQICVANTPGEQAFHLLQRSCYKTLSTVLPRILTIFVLSFSPLKTRLPPQSLLLNRGAGHYNMSGKYSELTRIQN